MEKQAYIQGWDFEVRSYKDTYEMFVRMVIAEAIYEGAEPSRNNQRAEDERVSSGSKKKGGASA